MAEEPNWGEVEREADLLVKNSASLYDSIKHQLSLFVIARNLSNVTMNLFVIGGELGFSAAVAGLRQVANQFLKVKREDDPRLRLASTYRYER